SDVPVASSSRPPRSPDLDAIPQDLQQRMDVVTGGAASRYGSGAMRGVVELVLNNRLGIRSPAAEFASESVDSEWSSRMRKEIEEGLAALGAEVSITRIECRSASCGVALKWPALTDQSGDQQRQREERFDKWVQGFSSRSGFARSTTSWM